MATILTVVGVGVSLAALHVSLFRLLNLRIGTVDQRIGGVEGRLDQRIGDVEERLDKRIGDVEERLDQRLTGLDQRLTGLERQMSDVRERMAKLEGAVAGFMAGHGIASGPAA